MLKQEVWYQIDLYSLSSVDPQTSSPSNSSGSSELVSPNRPGASVTRHLFLESFDLYSMMTTCDLAAALPISELPPQLDLGVGCFTNNDGLNARNIRGKMTSFDWPMA